MILFDQPFHGDCKAGHIGQLLVGDLDIHMLPAVRDGFLYFLTVGNSLLYFGSKLRQRNGR